METVFAKNLSAIGLWLPACFFQGLLSAVNAVQRLTSPIKLAVEAIALPPRSACLLRMRVVADKLVRHTLIECTREESRQITVEVAMEAGTVMKRVVRNIPVTIVRNEADMSKRQEE